MKTVEIFTRQHEHSIYELLNKGRITNKEYYVRLHMGPDADYFTERYGTFVKMAEKYVERPLGIEYPIWGSTTKENCLKPTERELVYCLEVPQDQVIYFDGLKWDYVLNYLYVPLNEEDQKRFQQKLDQVGIDTEFFILLGKYKNMFPEIEQEIRDSWERIFIIDDWKSPWIQANLWGIEENWVKRIVHPGEDIFEENENPFELKREIQRLEERNKEIGSAIF